MSKKLNRVGEKYNTSKSGVITIVEYNNANDVKVMFDDGSVSSSIIMSQVKEGYVRKPFNRVGEIYKNNEGYEVEIIEYMNATNCTIKFNDIKQTVLEKVQYANIKRGTVTNPFHPSVCGVGYLGIGKHTCMLNGEISKTYKVWYNMLLRCYDEKIHQKYPTYKDVTVCDEWKCFQNFAQWFEENYNPEVMEGWHLDKDILAKENKLYSHETCAFVPAEINTLFVKSGATRGNLPIGITYKYNRFIAQVSTKKDAKKHIGSFSTHEEAFQAYKTAKEEYIKEEADEWRGKISEQVYQAMYNYTVEITD